MTYLLGLPVAAGSSDIVVFEVDRGEVSGDLVLARRFLRNRGYGRSTTSDGNLSEWVEN